MSITSAKSGATGISLALDNNFMEPIATVLVGSGGVNNITFSDIPQGYKHLQVRGIMRCSVASDNILIRFNGDTAANYAWHVLRGSGSAASAAGVANASSGELGWTTYSGQTASAFAGIVIDILDYANSNKNKTVRSLSGGDVNGGGYITFGSSLWNSTTAINTINIVMGSGNFDQYSRLSLYGIKG